MAKGMIEETVIIPEDQETIKNSNKKEDIQNYKIIYFIITIKIITSY